MPAVTKNRAIELFWRVHPVVYRLTGGRLLGYLADGDAFVVAASYAGEPRSFAEYERRTARRIPVVVLEPVRLA